MTPAYEIASGLFSLMLKVFLIVMPLIMFLEWARTQAWFTRVINSTNRVFSPIGFRPQSLFPLMIGVLFGISYGAGVLIPQSRSGEMGSKQIFLVAAYLCLCHAIVEDTLLFVALGASAWIILITRFTAAMLIVFLLSRLPWPSDPQPAPGAGSGMKP
jgi:hypothetical protein